MGVVAADNGLTSGNGHFPALELLPQGCDRELRRGVEDGRLLLENGSWEPRPVAPPTATELVLWVPLPLPAVGVIAYRRLLGEEGGPAPPSAGAVVVPAELLQGPRGRLHSLRLLRSARPAPCCGSRQVLELVDADLVFRGWVHAPSEQLPEALTRLRSEYPPRAAADWAVCEWHGHPLDPLMAAGLLLHWVQDPTPGPFDAPHVGRAPSLHVLWCDADGEPRGWEAFADLPDPRELHRALSIDFRYSPRDEALLVVDRTDPPLLDRPAGEDDISAQPFARPSLGLLHRRHEAGSRGRGGQHWRPIHAV